MANGGRPTGETILLMLVGTICVTILAAGAGVFVVALVYPERDVSHAIQAMAIIIANILGQLSGYMIGVRRANGKNGHPPT